jgi:UPF0716 protein FxsA
MLRLFVLFTLVPAAELWLLFELSNGIGGMETVWLILFTGLIGAAMARQQGATVLQQLIQDAQEGRPSGKRIFEGVMVLSGGLLLITPGILTDAAGLAMIFPPTRKLLLVPLQRYTMGRLNIQPMGAAGEGFHAGPVGAGPGMPQSVHTESEEEPKRKPAQAIAAEDDWDHPVID